MDWKDNLDPILKDFLKALLSETKEYKDIYIKSEDPAKAQIWIALALLYRKYISLESKINELENILNDKEAKEKLEEFLKKL
ncbi:hypothetical protein MJ1_0779 [Nanobdella aerobiophila]|uniref:Uncharacterized protein n=1 Tax=Nanobdella aerobiophila TaxID=2586965 RepID=A0A915SG60_9ARCH|nr:hypothetical protein [Nanobdella aerobiophila]BBL45914.1 hypothetical protein MJ1_0779 [Nanobdella aerobiophila]